MHLHHLLAADRLVQLDHDPDGQQDPGAGRVATVPIMSAPAARAPTEAPEITATTGMYRSSTRRKTRGSRRNPGICIPLDSIWRATSSGPMFVVMIQNFANMTDPPMNTSRNTRRCTKTCQYWSPRR